VAVDPPSIRIRADELRTVREAMRDLGSLLGELDDGDVEKLVLTQRNRLRAVVVSVERWSEAEQALARLGEPARPSRSNGATGAAAIRRDRPPAL
jgi:PHD/YefM family antitoxin component YafN of YafNO toxin-antitoxin module